MHVSSLLASAMVAGLALAHPGHDHTKEMADRREYLATRETDLSHCADKVRERGLQKRAVERRQKMADELFAKRGLKSMTCP
jgi:sulfur relay (sulfurtransferase) complex TusBCD TusD component (DsrE family)